MQIWAFVSCGVMLFDNSSSSLPYFFAIYFPFQNNPKNLDLSYNRSRSLGLFRKGKTGIVAKFIGLI